MSCIGNDCFIAKQEARNPVLKFTTLGECGPDEVEIEGIRYLHL